MRKLSILFVVASFLACAASVSAVAQEGDKLAERLLRASEGLQMPSSESDSSWSLISYAAPNEPPEAESFGEMVGCPRGGTTRLDFDATIERLGTVERWMDDGQAKSARGFRKLGGVFEHEFGDDLAVYRCDGNGPEVGVYFVGAGEEGLRGLATISIET